MATKANIKVARELLERFFRDAEGRTNRQLDVYFTVQDLELPREKSDPALEFLTSRGLINTFGPDIAYLTDKGAQAIIEDMDFGELPKEIRDFGSKQPPVPPKLEPQEAAPSTEDLAPPAPRPPRPQVTHIDPEGKEYVLPLNKVCTIGRSPGNDIQVNDQRASKRHAEIRWDNFRFMMVDLGSANGTLLNGEYTDQAVLEHDDELVIGRTMLIFQCPEGRLAEPADKPLEDEDATDDIAPELQRATERPPRIEVVEQLPPPSLKVVKGRPEVHLAPAPEPLDDLFAEEPTPQPTELYEQVQDTDSARAAAPQSADLFAPDQPDRAPPDDDLFNDEITPTRKRSSDVFTPPSMRVSDEQTVNSSQHPQLVEIAPDGLLSELERSGELPFIDPVELAPAMDPLYEPMSPTPVRSRDPMPEERTNAEHVPMMSPDYEPANVDMPAFENWDGVTSDDVMLSNQPVIAEIEVPDIPEIRPTPLAKDEDAATVMVSRNDLFMDDPPARDDLMRWGDDRPSPMESHPQFAAGPDPVEVYEGEVIPVASHSMVNLRAPAADPNRGSAFHRTLAALRARAERADLPDRAELLDAIELLEKHAYVRVALALIERDDN